MSGMFRTHQNQSKQSIFQKCSHITLSLPRMMNLCLSQHGSPSFTLLTVKRLNSWDAKQSQIGQIRNVKAVQPTLACCLEECS